MGCGSEGASITVTCSDQAKGTGRMRATGSAVLKGTGRRASPISSIGTEGARATSSMGTGGRELPAL